MYALTVGDVDRTPYRARFRDTLDAVMDYRGIDSVALSARIGVNVETVRRWRRGVTIPSAEDLAGLVTALDVPIDLLLYPPATRGETMAAMVAWEQVQAGRRGVH